MFEPLMIMQLIDSVKRGRCLVPNMHYTDPNIHVLKQHAGLAPHNSTGVPREVK